MPNVRTQAFKVQPGDVGAQMMSVSSDVNKDHRTADARRIKPPPGWHVLGGEVPLNVLNVKLTDGPNRPCTDHGPGLPHCYTGYPMVRARLTAETRSVV